MPSSRYLKMEISNVVMNCIFLSMVTFLNVKTQSIIPHSKCENIENAVSIDIDLIKTIKDLTELTGQIKKEINYQMDQLKKEMIQATDQLKREMNETIGQLKKEKNETTGQLKKVMNETIGQLKKEMNETTGQLKKEKNETTGQLKKVMNETIGQLKKEMNETIGQLKKETNETIGQLKKEMNETIGQLKKETNETIGQLKKEMKERIGQQLKKKMNETINHIKEETNETIYEIKKELKKVSKKLFPPLSAFHAVSTSDQGIGVVVFKQVLTNIGYAYDSTTGIFTALSNGTYIFSWSVETYGVRTDTVLEVNGVVNGTVTADETSSYYDTSTSFAVLELQKGDAVNIRVKRGTAKSTRTMFSGWQYSSSDQISAFYASLTSRGRSKAFLFDKVHTNQDSVYTPHDGYFTAPRDGLYVFTSSISVSESEEYNYHIYTKGLKGPYFWVHSTTGQYDNTGSMNVAYMSAGEKAHVGAGLNDKAESGSMFAGWMAAPGNPSNYPAFIASLPFDSESSPIIFTNTFMSPHTGFDSSTGIFTATINGVYVFLWNIEAQSQVTTTSLRVNGVDRGQTRSDGRRTEYDDSAAVSVVELEVGDHVSVIILSGTTDGLQTMFCGWLLFKL